MKALSRVVWSDGMHLTPHHFQAQNRYFEDSMRFAAASLWLQAYGLLTCQIDAEALANGTISLVHARGIFPDGLLFQMPEGDPLPATRRIADLFPPTRDHVMVMLAIPLRKQAGLNCAMSKTELEEAPRYVAELRSLCDENTGGDEKALYLGRKNIRFLLDTESVEHFSALPIARVLRSGSGQFVLDPLYIPPCLQISASPRILTLLGRLIEIMEEKGRALTGSRSAGESSSNYSTKDIDGFWFLHTINSSLNVLRHEFAVKHGHPEQLYVELLQLAGALCTFALDSHPRTLPVYDHAHLDECYGALDDHIRKHLEIIIRTNCISIPLKPMANYFFGGSIPDSRCFGRSRWIFAIRAAMGHVNLIRQTQELVKICSQRFIQELVARGVRGLDITHVPVPPAAISAKVETQYFEISKSGGCWSTIVDTKGVGVYVPGEFPEPEVELLVVLDE